MIENGGCLPPLLSSVSLPAGEESNKEAARFPIMETARRYFKLFKKKDDKKNNGQNFSLSDKSKFAIVESYKAARTNIMFSLSAKEKNALP